MQNPTLLLVDEPTSSLDPKIGREVMELMCEVARERHIPLLFSVHDIALAKDFSQRIIGLKEGEKIFDKETSSLDNQSLEKIYKIESGKQHTKVQDRLIRATHDRKNDSAYQESP